MILACEYARKNKIPYFGICLGMQCAVIEVGFKDWDTENVTFEF